MKKGFILHRNIDLKNIGFIVNALNSLVIDYIDRMFNCENFL